MRRVPRDGKGLSPAMMAIAIMSGSAQANDFHYRNLLIGARASGLGGAELAAGDDPSSLYYSPAAAVDTSEGSSGTLNAVNSSRVTISGFFPDGSALKDRSNGLLPSYFGSVRRIGPRTTAGFSVVVSDFVQERQADQGTGLVNGVPLQSFLSGDVSNRTYQAGPTLALNVDETTALGLTLYGVYRDSLDSRSLAGNATRHNSDGTIGQFNASANYRITDTSYGLRPVLGLREHLGGWTLAATASYEADIHRNYRYLSHELVVVTQYDPGGQITRLADTPTATDTDGRSSRLQRRPFGLSVGIARQLTPWLLASFQTDAYTAVRQHITEGVSGAPPVTRQNRQVTNFAIGLEARFNPKVTLRAGLFTDAANVDFSQVQTYERREQIDLIGGSLATSFKYGKQRLDIGAYYSAGRGKGTLGTFNVIDLGNGVRDARQQNWTVFMGIDF